MVKLYNKATNEYIGRISLDELAFLQDHLEEEGTKDRDYYMTRETIEEFAASAGATEHLVNILRGALRSDNALEIRWERDSV